MLNEEKVKHEIKSWVSARMVRGRREAFAEVVYITPDLARELLAQNDENRAIKPHALATLIADIINGRWQLNGETIIVASDGYLNDGQHRLRAVIATGVPVQSMMVFGVPRESRFTVDMGAAKTPADFMGMQKVKSANSAAAITRLLDLYQRGQFNKNAPWQTKQYLLETYRQFSHEIDEATHFASVAYGTGKDIVTRTTGLTAIGATHVILTKIYPTAAELFLGRFVDGAMLEPDDPILRLRSRVLLFPEERVLPFERCAMILHYWNVWRQGNKVKKNLPLVKEWPQVRK